MQAADWERYRALVEPRVNDLFSENNVAQVQTSAQDEVSAQQNEIPTAPAMLPAATDGKWLAGTDNWL